MMWRRCGYWWVVLGLAWIAGGCSKPAPPPVAQPGRQAPRPPVKGFQVQTFYPAQPGQTNRLKSLLWAAEAQVQFGGPVPIKGLRIVTFGLEGKTNTVVDAPECIYDERTKTASSPGEIQLHSGDGRLSVQGRGFLWYQTNSSLAVSNDTITVIHQTPPVEIRAKELVYDAGTNRVTYRGTVHVAEPQLELSSDLLVIQMREGKDPLESAEADGNVVVINKADNSRATGAHATYQQTPGQQEMVEMAGKPTWRQGLREGKADLLRFERQRPATSAFTAVGHTLTRIPRSEASLTGPFFPLGGPLGVTNGTAPVALASTNRPSGTNAPPQFIDIYADEAQLLPTSGRFVGSVVVNDIPPEGPPGTAKCESLLLQSTAAQNTSSNAPTATPDSAASRRNELDYVLMQENVVLEQGDQQVKGDRLEYTKTNDLAVVTGHPSWRMGPQEGSADVLLFHPDAKALTAQTNAMMTLHLGAGGQQFWSLFKVATNSPGASNQFLTVRSQSYDYQPGNAFFRDGVKVTSYAGEAAQGHLTSEQMQVRLSIPQNQVEQLHAERNVVFERGIIGITNGPDAYQRMSCDRVNAQAENGQMENMVAEGHVAFEQAAVHGTSGRAVYFVKTDTVVLLDDPVLKHPRGTLTGPAFIIDRLQNRFSVRTGWKLQAHLKSNDRTKK